MNLLFDGALNEVIEIADRLSRAASTVRHSLEDLPDAAAVLVLDARRQRIADLTFSFQLATDRALDLHEDLANERASTKYAFEDHEHLEERYMF